MYLSHRQVQALQSVLATLSQPADEREMRLEIGQPLLDLFDAQYYVSYVWNDPAHEFRQGQCLNFDPAHLRLYEQYFQFRDPITSKMQSHRAAIRATDVMAQPDLERTEFFNEFLALDGLHWGVNLYAWQGQQNLGDLRIWRDRRHSNFSAEELDLLNLLRAPFVAALQRLRPGPAPAAAFHGRGLSSRELDVVEQILLGLSDKEISRALDMALPTVRTHLRSIFRKCEVDSRIKLHRLANPPHN